MFWRDERSGVLNGTSPIQVGRTLSVIGFELGLFFSVLGVRARQLDIIFEIERCGGDRGSQRAQKAHPAHPAHHGGRRLLGVGANRARDHFNHGVDHDQAGCDVREEVYFDRFQIWVAFIVFVCGLISRTVQLRGLVLRHQRVSYRRRTLLPSIAPHH